MYSRNFMIVLMSLPPVCHQMLPTSHILLISLRLACLLASLLLRLSISKQANPGQCGPTAAAAPHHMRTQTPRPADSPQARLLLHFRPRVLPPSAYPHPLSAVPSIPDPMNRPFCFILLCFTSSTGNLLHDMTEGCSNLAAG